MRSSLELSIVFGTLNRLPFLKRALQSCAVAAGNLRYEIIVIDGGSTDGTLEWLQIPKIFPAGKKPQELRVIWQGERRGAVDAFTEGFQAAGGEYVATFNDDAEYVGSPLAAAVAALRKDPTIGQVAIPFSTQRVHRVEEIAPGTHPTPEVALVRLPKVGKVPYANFGVISRALGNQLGWWGTAFYQYAGDTHLSASVWAAGKRVVALAPAQGYLIHYQVYDETRVPNVETATFNAIWRGESSPLQDVPTPTAPPPEQHDARLNVLMRYLGGRHGNNMYQRSGSPWRYIFSALDREAWVAEKDVPWLLQQQAHGKPLFERAVDPMAKREQQHG